MPTLLSSLLKALIFFVILTSCKTNSAYNIKTIPDPVDPSSKSFDLQVIHVNSNRIKQECYFVNAEGDQNWRHQYFLYILKDNNTVMILMHPFNQDDDQCNEQLTKIDKIIKTSSEVKICARSELKINTELIEPNKKHDFKNLGSHPESGEVLTLDRIVDPNPASAIVKYGLQLALIDLVLISLSSLATSELQAVILTE